MGLLLLVLVTFLPVRQLHAEPKDSYTEALVSRAQRLRLAEHASWLRLGHYRKGLFGGQESQVDGAPFFLAANGKTDPQAELAATLRGFFAAPAAEHAICRFPARFYWLSKQLAFEPRKVPKVSCPRYADFLTRLAPSSITLIFSSYFLNNPASAFGHTFLRVNKAAGSGDREGRELLDYGIDFAAVVDTNNAILYAFKGLVGLFPGAFHKVPFHYKVREYNDFESRDLWEYDLDLSPEQVRLVVAHLWELGSTYIAYYYLSENCSYHILGALEVASPDLELTSKLGWPVIPADTVKALMSNRGLVKRVHYRPSNRTIFKNRVNDLSADELRVVEALIRNPQAPFPGTLSLAAQVKVLDAAIDLVGVKFAREIVKDRNKMDPEGIELEQALLERRAGYDIEGQEPVFPASERQMPHEGHDSSRLGLGSGYERDEGFYHTLSLRLALHDLADPVHGYPDGAEIEFLPTSFRYYVESPRITFEDFSLVRVMSLTPLTRFDSTYSWMVDLGAKRAHDSGCDECVTGFGALGAGFTIEPFGSAFTLFAMAHAELNLPLESGFFDIARVGIGPFGGLRLRFSKDVTSLFTGSWHYLPGQEPQGIYAAHGALRAQYTRDFALGLEGRLMDRAASAQAVSYIYF